MSDIKGNLVIHYHRNKADYENWSVWLWEIPQKIGKQFEFDNKDSFGIYLSLPLSNWTKNAIYNNIGLIIKRTDSWGKDGSDKIIKFYKMDPDQNGDYHVYVLQNDDNLYRSEKLERIQTFDYAKFIDFQTVAFKTCDSFTEYRIFEDGKIILEEQFSEPKNDYKISLKKDINLSHDYKVEIKLFKNEKCVHRRVRFAELYKLEKFQNQFHFEGELGAICERNSTTFRVWSPVSRKMVLRVYKNGTPTDIDGKNGNDDIFIEKEMKKAENGVFSVKISRNLHGFYYTYVVTNDVYKTREIVDIYAKSAGLDGQRGMVVDFNKIDDYGLSKIAIHPYNPRKLTVYETHIADLTSSKTWTNDKKKRKFEKTFLGACLEGTTYSENGRRVSTGFDHIKELGVNAVQLLPVFDQVNDEVHLHFNWGYNPLNYNVLEGGYSSNPYDGEVRIKEFKYMVKKYHDAGINIIMDVVYNHVYAAVGSSFDVLMPGYYFRYAQSRVLSNASGCGNETASDRLMFRKFMIDSVLFFAKEYKIGGFRFDLMAIHDINTMNLLVKALHDYDKNIVVYGEPWAADRSMLDSKQAAHKGNANKFKGYGFFSDSMRNALLRTSKDLRFAGWCANSLTSCVEDQKRIVQGIKGMADDVLDPNKIVNYASCHDNRTLFDRVKFNGITNENEAKRVAMLANSIVFTSNGISFMLAGEEFYRTKGGADNSYNLSFKINELDYSLKLHNLDTFKNYQKLISLKQKVFDLSLDKELNQLLQVDFSKPNMISYELDEGESGRKYKVFHVNGYRTGPVILNLQGYELYLDTINPHKELSTSTSLIPYETLIVYKQ